MSSRSTSSYAPLIARAPTRASSRARWSAASRTAPPTRPRGAVSRGGLGFSQYFARRATRLVFEHDLSPFETRITRHKARRTPTVLERGRSRRARRRGRLFLTRVVGRVVGASVEATRTRAERIDARDRASARGRARRRTTARTSSARIDRGRDPRRRRARFAGRHRARRRRGDRAIDASDADEMFASCARRVARARGMRAMRRRDACSIAFGSPKAGGPGATRGRADERERRGDARRERTWKI